MSNYKTVFFTLGILLVILGVAMLIPVIFQLFYMKHKNEYNSRFDAFFVLYNRSDVFGTRVFLNVEDRLHFSILLFVFVFMF